MGSVKEAVPVLSTVTWLTKDTVESPTETVKDTTSACVVVTLPLTSIVAPGRTEDPIAGTVDHISTELMSAEATPLNASSINISTEVARKIDPRRYCLI